MNQAIKILAVLFVVQLGLIIGFNVTGQNADSGVEAKPLLPGVSAAELEEFIIKDSDGAQTRFVRQDNKWVMPDYGGLPATQSAVNELLDSLTDATVKWPVATSSAAAERFEVNDGNAQRTLEFYSGGKKLHTLYLGTSPSYKKMHARIDDSKNIYTAALAQYEARATPEDWFDKAVLQVEGTIRAVKTGELSLVSQKTAEADGEPQLTWRLESPDVEEPLDSDAIAAWVKRFNTLVVSKLAPEDKVQEIVLQNPVKTINISLEDGTGDFAFYQHNDAYYVKRFGSEAVFEVAKYQAEPIVNANVETFLVKSEEEEETGDSDDS